ncbi:hypothetical protein NE237_008591 [Protea cynaroides]|uniref:RING-type domain-containing protein n=1 Tax=Protea cynaroides TaxID=273540 RepID=A0A9Q0KX06_9MAGN|nr:hypothetical protein NE237_008591 [Protea cynaroides]
MIASSLNLVMTVIGFAVSTMFIVFVCTRLICARIQLNASRRSFPTASTSHLSLLERGLHGLEPVFIATFPTKKFSDDFFFSREDSQCTVCLAEYQETDVLRILPYCGHSFHVSCIDVWLQQHCTCPVCRISLRQSPERRLVMQPRASLAIRPPYGMDATSHHLYTSHGYSSGTVDGRRMEPIHEDHCASEAGSVEAGGVSASLNEDNQVPKDSGLHRLEIKNLESPSVP